MKRKTIIIATAATLIGLGALGVSASLAQGPYGKGGYGWHGAGYDTMQSGPGYGPGKMYGKFGRGDCRFGQAQTLDTPLSVEDVRAQIEKRLQWRGNDRLKVGSVTDKDENTIVAEIVTVDDSLVRKIEIDKNTGRRTPVN